MTESFAALFEESELNLNVEKGAVIQGTVVSIDSDWVTVDTGLKSEGVVDRAEFLNEQRELEVQVGDTVDVVVEALDNGMGQTVLSREKAKRAETWTKLEKIFEDGEIVTGVISGKVKGGFTVDIGPVRAFLPGSLVDTRPIRDTTHLEGKELEFKVIKLDAKRNNVVVSRRAVMEAESSADREALLAQLEEGQTVTGTIKNLTDYGAFVEIESGIEGLVHVSEMDWTNKNVAPSKAVSLGTEVEVMVLDIDEDKRRISLGIKQCKANPWEEFSRSHQKGDKIKGAIKSITDFGVFIGLPGAIDGLVHLSDLSWNEPGEEAVKAFKKGDELEAVVLAIDVEKERISLGIKQMSGDPFNNYTSTSDKGSLVSGTVKSVDAKGAVIHLADEVEGYLRASEISTDRVEDARNALKEGDTVSAMIINIDRKSRSINLSIKAKDSADQQDTMNKLQSDAGSGTTNLGALLKAKMDNQS